MLQLLLNISILPQGGNFALINYSAPPTPLHNSPVCHSHTTHCVQKWPPKHLFLIFYQHHLHISSDVVEIQKWKIKKVSPDLGFKLNSSVSLVKKGPQTNILQEAFHSQTKLQQFPCSTLSTSLLFVLAAIRTAIWATSSLTKTKADSLSLWPEVVVYHPSWHRQRRPALKGGWIMDECSPEVLHLPNQCAWSSCVSFSCLELPHQEPVFRRMCSFQLNNKRVHNI